MKLRVLSDLHVEFTRYEPALLPSIGEDVVVLAGDIGIGVEGIEWAIRAIPDRRVLYVLGNHEFYGYDFDRLIDSAREAANGSQVQVLEQDRVLIDGICFLGATLWTDFEVQGARRRHVLMECAERLMSDFRLIRTRGELLTPQDTAERCRQTAAWLERQIATSEWPTVVITHHSPSLANEHPSFRGMSSAGAFHSNLEHLFKAPVKLWISGHTHHSSSVEVRGIPLITNQRGYPNEASRFTWDRIVEV